MKTVREIVGRNPIHPFPARMAPSIALEALGESNRRLQVLDPMAGSGTVLAVSQAAGHDTFGFDVDPLAVLLARVWSTPIDTSLIVDKAAIVLDRARAKFEDIAVRDAYPVNADKETKSFIRYWFDAYSRRQLTALSIVISRVRSKELRDALWCAFSRLIVTKSAGASLAMDLSHSRPHRVFEYAPVKPFNRFLDAALQIAKNVPHSNDIRSNLASKVEIGDARNISLGDSTIDVVITSPPYLNMIDYIRCSKFSLVWMGLSISQLRSIRSKSIGTDRGLYNVIDDKEVEGTMRRMGKLSQLAPRRRGMITRYVIDMTLTMNEIARVLKPNGSAVLVVGDSTLGGTYISNSKGVIHIARSSGLSLKSVNKRILPPNRRYLPPPSSNTAGQQLANRMREEVVIRLSKEACI